MAEARKIIILGSGFGGLYAALEFEKVLQTRSDLDVVLVNRDNYFLFTPMLHEIAASDLDITHIVNPVRKLLKRVRFFNGDVDSINVEGKEVVVSHGLDVPHSHTLPFDDLIISLGSETNFFNLPGVEERALTMKSLGDAIYLRNRMIEHMEEADFECCKDIREALLTFVVAGGGFSGVETVAAMHDFLLEALPSYPNLRPEHVKLILVNSGEYVLPELGEKLGRYTQKKLSERGMEVITGAKVKECSGDSITLTNGRVFSSRTLVWTAGTRPNPLLDKLPCPREKGKLVVDEFFRSPGWDGVWALGDCALVPDIKRGGFHPPTAQHAIREGKVLAQNVLATMAGTPLKPFTFTTIGQLAAIGKRTGVARVLGINFSGFFAWWLWRSVYLGKLPRFEKKVRVALDWALDVVFSKDIVKFMSARGSGAGFGAAPRGGKQ